MPMEFQGAAAPTPNPNANNTAYVQGIDNYVHAPSSSGFAANAYPGQNHTGRYSNSNMNSGSNFAPAQPQLKKNLNEIFGWTARCETKVWYAICFRRYFGRKWHWNESKMLSNFGIRGPSLPSLLIVVSTVWKHFGCFLDDDYQVFKAQEGANFQQVIWSADFP
jgi:hypothetical protein